MLLFLFPLNEMYVIVKHIYGYWHFWSIWLYVLVVKYSWSIKNYHHHLLKIETVEKAYHSFIIHHMFLSYLAHCLVQ